MKRRSERKKVKSNVNELLQLPQASALTKSQI